MLTVPQLQHTADRSDQRWQRRCSVSTHTCSEMLVFYETGGRKAVCHCCLFLFHLLLEMQWAAGEWLLLLKAAVTAHPLWMGLYAAPRHRGVLLLSWQIPAEKCSPALTGGWKQNRENGGRGRPKGQCHVKTGQLYLEVQCLQEAPCHAFLAKPISPTEIE